MTLITQNTAQTTISQTSNSQANSIQTKLLIKTSLVTALVLTAFSSYGQDHYSYQQSSFYDRAKVISVTPIVEQVKIALPRQKCKPRYYQKQYRPHDDGDTLTTVAGAVIGGVVGNQVLKNSKYRDIGTVAGAVIGGSITSNSGHNSYQVHHSNGGFRHHHQCRDRYQIVDEIVAYQVKYRYQGEIFSTRMKHHPGKRIDVKVSVSPV